VSINLTKGQKISLTKDNPTLSQVKVGLGWDVNRYDSGTAFDLDASVFMCGANGKCRKDSDFIFYGNLSSPDGAIRHMGDDRTGGNSDVGDDEEIIIDLNKIPADVHKIAITATIYDAVKRSQNFGMVSNAYIRVVDSTTDKEVVRYDLGEDFSIETAIVIGEIYRRNNEWKFNAIGAGYQGGLAALCASYGIDAE
jgi:tellurium resistance protein TerD